MKELLNVLVLLGVCYINPEKCNSEFSKMEIMSHSEETLIDERDNKTYKLLKVDSLLWFNENLSYWTENSKPINKNLNEDSGRLYSFSESKIVCPQGWRLPTLKEFDNLIELTFHLEFDGLESLDFDWSNIGDNQTGFNFDQTGFIHKRKHKSKASFNLWLHDSEKLSGDHSHMYKSKKWGNNKLIVFRHNHTKHKPKKHRKFAIRCVCPYNERN